MTSKQSADALARRAQTPPPPPSLPAALADDYLAVRAQPLFTGISNEEIAALLGSGGLRVVSLDRDQFVVDPVAIARGQAAPVVIVLAGQVAAAVFSEADLAERRANQERLARATTEELSDESRIKPPPLARVAQKNVALFAHSDVFNAAAIAATRGMPVAFYTTAPADVLLVSQDTLADMVRRHPQFEARLTRALASAKERMAWLFGVKQEVLDFFVRQGVSVAGDMVRVRQLDLCIDCKQCEDACQERYGAKRLTLGGFQLGLLDFVYTCRTCTDQRCIDPCAYDSIKYDAVRKEVVINEATCTGCTACAQSCPYGAIDMVETDTGAPTFKAEFVQRLEKKGALAFGPGTPRIAKPRRIANKCDHCGAYGDQACVSACPTGALIEIDPYALFKERTKAMSRAADTGFTSDPTAAKKAERGEMLPVMPFLDSLGVRNAGLAKVRRARALPIVFWMVGIVALVAILAEILLRKYAPGLSYLYYQLKHSAEFKDLPEAAVLEKVFFRAGDKLSVWVGVAGTALMFVAAIYPMFRRVRLFRWLASNTMWFDFHMMAGWIGPLLIVQHSALKLDTWVSAAFWSMIIVVASGVLGRYLYTQVPVLSSGVELEELDNERFFAQSRISYPQVMTEIDRELGERQAHARHVAQSPSVLRALAFMLSDDFGKYRRNFMRSARLRRFALPWRVRREFVKRTASAIRIARGQVVAPKAQLLLHSWKKVHVPFTIIMTAFSVAHIYLAWGLAW